MKLFWCKLRLHIVIPEFKHTHRLNKECTPECRILGDICITCGAREKTHYNG